MTAQNPLLIDAASYRHPPHDDGKRYCCKACGENVSVYNCNPGFVFHRPDAEEWDWWMACDNAACEHAHGEGKFQELPDWVGRMMSSDRRLDR